MVRRLAEAPDSDEYTKKELVKRVKLIEDVLAGIDS